MPTAKFYAVATGRKTGIYRSWSDCEKQTKGFPKARFKSFKTEGEAQDFVRTGGSAAASSISSTSNAPVGDSKKCKRVLSAPTQSTLQQQPQPQPQPQPPTAKRQRRLAAGERRLKIHLMFDGGARGNPGVAGSGSSVIVQDVTNATNAFRRTVYIRYYVGDNATNNQAEYQGLLYGLASAQREARLFAQSQSQLLTIDLIVQGDSNLIIEQLKGNYSCKSEKLKPLFRKAKQMLASFSNVGQCTFSLEHVYRKDNKVADGLANEAMDSRRSWFTTSDDDHEQQHDTSAFDPALAP